MSSIVLSIAAAVIVGGERLPLRTFLLVGLAVCGMSTLGLMDEVREQAVSLDTGFLSVLFVRVSDQS